MKKIILSAAMLLVFGVTNAQETKEAEKACPIKYGVKAGINYDWLQPGDFSVKDFHPQVGFHVGLLAELQLCENFAVQPELLYSQHSFINEPEGVPSAKLKVSEITLPVAFKFYLTKALSLEVGPQVSMIMSGDYDGEDIKDDLRDYNVAAIFGLSYDFGKGVFVQVRNVYNFLDLQNTPERNNFYGLQASVGYKF